MPIKIRLAGSGTAGPDDTVPTKLFTFSPPTTPRSVARKSRVLTPETKPPVILKLWEAWKLLNTAPPSRVSAPEPDGFEPLRRIEPSLSTPHDPVILAVLGLDPVRSKGSSQIASSQLDTSLVKPP
jgi:hypothetical protein